MTPNCFFIVNLCLLKDVAPTVPGHGGEPGRVGGAPVRRALEETLPSRHKPLQARVGCDDFKKPNIAKIRVKTGTFREF